MVNHMLVLIDIRDITKQEIINQLPYLLHVGQNIASS